MHLRGGRRVSSVVPGTTQNDFLALLDEAIGEMGDKGPHLCGSIPFDPGDKDRPFVRSGPHARVIVQMEGRHRRAISARGKRVDLDVAPYQCIYLVPGAWDIEFSDSAGRTLGLTFAPSYVRYMVRVFDGVFPTVPSPFAYHTSKPMVGAGLAVSHALDFLAETNDRVEWSADLFKALLRFARRHLAEDRAEPSTHSGAAGTWLSVRTYLDEHFTPDISRESIAEALGMHPNYLSALARKMSGQAFRATLDEVRMQRARILLRTTNLKLLKVAEQCGYTDVGNFIKAFRRVVGITPGVFRKPGSDR